MKLKSFNSTDLMVAITGLGYAVIIGIGLFITSCQPTFDAKEYAKTNHCPYEGLECPNANEVFIQDSTTIDSLVNRTEILETQLAGCDFKEHSKLVRH